MSMGLAGVTNFDSTKEAVLDLLVGIKQGRTQLPDFQRGWVWNDDHVRSLLASISLSYPIGAVMMLEAGNADVRLKPRLIEGVMLDNLPSPDRLILDGQQRLTSLFQALLSGQPVATQDMRNKPIQRWYYLDIARALDPFGDREEAIVSVPQDRMVRNFRGEIIADYSTAEKECAAEYLPLPLVFDVIGLMNWQMIYVNQASSMPVQERLMRWSELLQSVIQRFQQYQVPLVILRKETPKVAVCQVFEKVNTGGVTLTVFELLTATFAADDYSLRNDWQDRQKRLQKIPLLKTIESTDFLVAVTLLATYERRRKAVEEQGTAPDRAPAISCKRKDVLQLSLADYKNYAERITLGFEKTARLLHTQRVLSPSDIPYRTQLIPLAAIFAILGDNAETQGVQAKLSQWYWCGVFGELYGGSVETRLAKDVPEVVRWIAGEQEPDTMSDAHFAPSRLLGLRTRNSAAYKGMAALLMRDGCRDLRTGTPVDVQQYFADRIDIHHIFPQAWCRKHNIDATRCDCIVNKTPLAALTNQMIGGSAPSSYLATMQTKAGITEAQMDANLCSHVIDVQALRSDDFDAFFTARQKALLDRIKQATGKPIAYSATPDVDTAPVDYEEEDVA